MNKIFKTKPEETEVAEYEERLNKYLQYLKGTVKINLFTHPLIMFSSLNNEKEELCYWVESVVFTSTTGDIVLLNSLLSEDADGKEKYFDLKFAWQDAVDIQNSVYSKLGKFTKNFSRSNGDPYWKLWDFLDPNLK
jgi:hypothetical protein